MSLTMKLHSIFHHMQAPLYNCNQMNNTIIGSNEKKKQQKNY